MLLVFEQYRLLGVDTLLLDRLPGVETAVACELKSEQW